MCLPTNVVLLKDTQGHIITYTLYTWKLYTLHTVYIILKMQNGCPNKREQLRHMSVSSGASTMTSW